MGLGLELCSAALRAASLVERDARRKPKGMSRPICSSLVRVRGRVRSGVTVRINLQQPGEGKGEG